MTVGRLWRSAPLLLAAASLFWSGNFIVGRAVHDSVPPFALAFWRWAISLLLIVGPAWPHVRRDAPVLWRHWRGLAVLGALGIAAYAVLVYLGLQSTTALNGLLLQSVTPLVMMACAFALFRDPVRPLQLLAIAVSIAGVVVIVTRGEPAALHGLSLHAGDVWLLAAVLVYSLYSVLLRIRPPVHPLSFLATTFAIGSVLLLPLYVWETVATAPFHPTLGALGAIGYLALFPGCISYLLWNRGVELIGPGAAGQYFHLLPVFGTTLAVLFLGETFQPYHGAGIVLIALGIALATWRRG